jgi:hypothetical protein
MPARVRKRKINVRSLVLALDGPERAYDVYRFSRGKRRFERPGHNPFDGLDDDGGGEPEPEPGDPSYVDPWGAPQENRKNWGGWGPGVPT